MARTVAAVAVVVAGAMLPGCGGEDDETTKRRPGASVTRTAPSRSGEAPTKAEFLKKADALCAKAKERAAPISAAVNAKIDNEDAIGVAAELRKGLPIADEFLEGIRALTPPRGDEAIVGRYVGIVAAQRRRIPPLVEALEAEDISSIEVLAAELRQGNRRAQRLTRGYGLTRCGPAGLPAR